MAQGSKRIRSHADMQREDAYGQPPPAKRQMVEHNVQRAVLSPTKSRSSSVRTLVQRAASRGAVGTDRVSSHASHKQASKEQDTNLVQWRNQTQSRFPKMVFYFESIPDDQRLRLAKLVTHHGAVRMIHFVCRRE
jgi:regulatory subunit for Cdc7p protein kinase